MVLVFGVFRITQNVTPANSEGNMYVEKIIEGHVTNFKLDQRSDQSSYFGQSVSELTPIWVRTLSSIRVRILASLGMSSFLPGYEV